MDKPSVPYVYLDANILLDVIRGRKTESTLLLEKIKKNEIKACTSHFCILELIDKEQEYFFSSRMNRNGYSMEDILRVRNQRNLNDTDLIGAFDKVNRQFIIPLGKHLDVLYLEGTGWDKAAEIMQVTNLHATDAIHVATSILAGCNLFVSNDRELIKNARKLVNTATPENYEKKLKELGF